MDTDLPPEFLDADFLILSAFTGALFMVQSLFIVIMGHVLRCRTPAWRGGAVASFAVPELGPCLAAPVSGAGLESKDVARPDQSEPPLGFTQLSAMSATIAHELRQPLSAILFTSQAAQRYLAGSTMARPELAGMLDDIVQAGQHASDVVRRMRATTCREPTPFRPLQLNDVVTEAMRFFNGHAGLAGVVLSIQLAEELPAVQGDPVQLIQVVSNLVSNACDALAAPRLAHRQLTVQTHRDSADQVGVTITDSGPGLAPEIAGKLFHPFATTKAHGAGLGLAISRLIVTTHLGRISGAANPDGMGARFTVTLPTAGARWNAEFNLHEDPVDDLCRG